MRLAAIAACVAALAIRLGSLNASPEWVSDAAVELSPAAVTVQQFTFEDLPPAWRKLAMCESSGNAAAVAGGRDQFQGLFQIEFPRTWVAHGGDPNVPPTAASVAEQYAVALHIFENRGSKPWPWCGRFLMKAYGR